MWRKYVKLMLVGSLMFSLWSCSLRDGPPISEAPLIQLDVPTPTGDTASLSGRSQSNLEESLFGQGHDAIVQEVEIFIGQTDSPQVSVVVRGEMADACVHLDEIQPGFARGTFLLSVNTMRAVDRPCADAAQTFERLVPLDVTGFAEGEYGVKVSGLNTLNRRFVLDSSQFILPEKNISVAQETPVATINAVDCQNQAQYVADITIPDGTVLAPEQTFVKTWRMRNTGDCTWLPDYALVFFGGKKLGEVESLDLQQIVPPGSEVDISITLVAPTTPGIYRSNWKFRNNQGLIFGSRGDNPIYVEISVVR